MMSAVGDVHSRPSCLAESFGAWRLPMKQLALLFAMVIGLTLMLNDTSSGGPPPLPATCSSPGCNPTVSDANQNTGGGTDALKAVSGEKNTAFGFNTLFSITNGNLNTAIGDIALYSNTSGSSNTACGAWTLSNNTTGDANTANGVNALILNTTGNNNTASGWNA